MLETNLRAVRQSTRGEPNKSAKALMLGIKRFKSKTYFGLIERKNTKDDAWELYEKIGPVVMEIKRTVEDQIRGA